MWGVKALGEGLFIKRTDVSPQDLVTSRSREIKQHTFQIILKVDRHLRSSNTVAITFNLAA